MTLEELLNKLIEKGWDVFPNKKFFWNKDKLRFSKWKKCVWFWNDDYTLRELVSKESWLWQFCKENKMLIWFSPRRWTKNAEDCWWLVKGDVEYWWSDYEYRIIESALRDEDGLEKFLLDNIKIWNEN